MKVDEKMEAILNRFDEVLDEQFKGWGVEEVEYFGKSIYAVIEGDWKHAHLRFDMLLDETLKEFNCAVQYKTEKEIGDSQCDWYESEHRFVIDLSNFTLPEAA